MNTCSQVVQRLMLVLICCIISACGNLAPVRTFADETKKLSAAFDPMLTGSSASCVEKYKRKKLITADKFDPEVAEKKAKELCGPMDDDNKTIADLNGLLEQYADTLAALADEKLPSYKTELNGLKNSLGKIKKPGTGEALINADKLGAITALTEFLSRIATQHMQKAAIRDLLSHEAAINTITTALKDYANLNYKAWLRDEKNEILVLRKALDERAAKEMLASNYLKTILLSEERQIAAREKTVDAFIKSVTELQKSNAEIRKKFDRLDDKELLDQLKQFGKEVAALRNQLKDAF
ncbi:hypothetical protein [Undibacterium umbellatum]|uniref:Lipoprotein n=1 Tax=Undibacterium umbellatum TaxID=2762300 RepID=A0ABR6ZDB9_9BURK|nr:hypothetical protein [Undibacterium umbellatum]MBC3909735.1 hypothetical protein [Undibacterium umbellatum]